MIPDGFAEGSINGRWSLILPDDRVVFHVERPGWEAERLASCDELMEPGMVVYDIGAECGDFTALYGIWVTEGAAPGTVVPIDPQAAYWPAIRQTWEANDLPPLEGLFVGFASDATDLNPPLLNAVGDALWPKAGHEPWPECAWGPIIPDFGFRHLAQQTDGTRQVRIDDMPWILGVRPPDAIVMDIEGAEYRALLGAERTLLDVRPLVWVSVHEPIMADWYGVTLDQLVGWMADCGYDGEMLGTSGGEDYWLFQPRPR